MASSFIRKIYGQRGIGLAFLSAMTFALNGLTYNLVTEFASVWLSLFVSILAYLPSAAFVRWEYKYRWMDTIFIFLTGLLGAGSLTSGAVAFSLTTVGNASAIIFSKPLFCALLGKLILDEPFGIYDTGVLITNFVGVILIAKPPFLFDFYPTDTDENDFVGSVVALICAILGSVQYIFVRKLVVELDTYDPALVLTLMSIIGFISCGTTILFADVELFHRDVSAPEYLLLLLMGSSSVFAFLFFLLALDSQNASVVPLVGTSEIVASFLLQALFTSDPIEWTSVAGACMITASAAWFTVKGLFSNQRIPTKKKRN